MDFACLRGGYESWFSVEPTTAGQILFQMQARPNIDETTNIALEWAIYNASDDPRHCGDSDRFTTPVAKGCTHEDGGVYSLPQLNVQPGEKYAVLVSTSGPAGIKVINVDPGTAPEFDCTGIHKFFEQANLTNAYELPTPSPTPSPTPPLTSSPTHAPTWPAHQFVPEIVRHDPWYEAYTNAPTPAGPVDYDIPTPPSPVYVPAKEGKTIFPYCLGFGSHCAPTYSHY